MPATLIIKRDSFFGRLVAMRIIIDRTKIGSIRNGTAIEFNIEGGNHEIQVGAWNRTSPPIPLTIKDGETRPLFCGFLDDGTLFIAEQNRGTPIAKQQAVNAGKKPSSILTILAVILAIAGIMLFAGKCSALITDVKRDYGQQLILSDLGLMVVGYSMLMTAVHILGLRKRSSRLKLGIWLASLAALILTAALLYLNNSKHYELRQMAQVCSGGRIPAAAAYIPGGGSHPTVLVRDGAADIVNIIGRPNIREPLLTSGEIELVLCLKTTVAKFLLENCSYQDRDRKTYTFNKYGETVEGRLITAKDGRIVSTFSLTSKGGCAMSLNVTDNLSSGTNEYFENLTILDFETWLKSYFSNQE